MCDVYRTCKNCPLVVTVQSARTCECDMLLNPEESERIIMQWAAENPIKTNGTKFAEVFGYRFADKIKTPEDLITWLYEEYKENK